MRGAGGGRPPKPEGQTRHRNPVYKDSIVIPPNARVARIPSPSLPFEGIRKKVWRQMWQQPVAVLWDKADIAVLTRMVVLQTTPDVYSSPRLLAELRQLEDRFLLNPYARAQQRVVLSDGHEQDNREAADVSDLDVWRRRLEARGSG
jgi:hypothetical protein